MMIDVYSDMVCPWCRIGKKNMSDAIAEWEKATGDEISVSFHAYQLDPNLPAEGKPFRQAMESKMGGADRLDPMLQRVTDAGAEIGLTFRFDKVASMPNTLQAHQITALLPAERQQKWVDAAMDAYFEHGRNIAELATLLDLAAEVGLDAEEIRRGLESGEGTAKVEQDLEAAKAMGISGVPFFIVNGKYALSGAYPVSQFLASFRKIAQQGAE